MKTQRNNTHELISMNSPSSSTPSRKFGGALVLIFLSLLLFLERGYGRESNSGDNCEDGARAQVTGGFELSGCAVVAEGLLLVEDELVGSVLLIPESGKGELRSTLLKIERRKKESQPFTKMTKLIPVQDFEGIASDGDEKVYLIGSHQAKDGTRRSDREFLIQAKWDAEDEELKLRKISHSLLERLEKPMASDLIGVPLELSTREIGAEVNIEGLAYREESKTIFIGLRSPVTREGEKAILFHADPDVFLNETADDNPDFFTLDLSGAGIRSLAWDPRSDRLLIISGPTADDGDQKPALWKFDPESNELKMVHEFERRNDQAPEGVARNSKGQVVIAFDSDEGRAADILFLDIE